MPDTRPNIILIITDQQRYDTIAALGFPYMDTPHLGRLVREGVSFSQSHVTAASCAPARASLFTGYYPHTTGVYKNADLWQHSWVERLAASGYHCVNIGKMHTFPYETPLGFHERFGGEQGPLPRGALLFRSLGHVHASARPDQTAARALSPAARLPRTPRRL